MSGPGYQTDEQIPEELVSAYRASVEDPPYDATDRALLRAAACRDTSRWPRLTSYAASRSFVAALAVVALVICASQVQRITSIFRGGNIDRQGLSRFFPAPIRTAKPVTPAGDYTPQDRKLRQAQGAADQKGPHDDEYLMNTMFGATYARENQLEQAAMALQFAADSQYATLALQAQATEPDLYAMELAERALRVQ